ncbi:Hint domain-containing protein [Ruegeria sp. 6PALISEP08]|uniref:Hint domain-containing protein n=1 Tax=Ruegeria sp. 6PALISEP08 TaxID=1225660 RepID=UPI000B0358F9|nr:Hint domain-containing protein [Ruegeria sp. 6PALISEP08]
MVAINFTTLLQNGSQTVVDADGDVVVVTATFTSDFFVNGSGDVQSDNAVDTNPDSFTLTFSKPVKDFTFTVGDVNSNGFGGGFNDQITVQSTLDGSPVVTNLNFGTSGTTAVYEAPFGTNVTETVTVPGPLDQITLTNFDPDQQHGWLFLTTGDIGDVVCFTNGTQIETDDGPKSVEDLVPGDRVLTRDNGYQPLRWIGRKEVSTDRLRENRKLRPVRIKAGALSSGLPCRDLVVSRQHRMLAVSEIARRMFGALEILVPAHKLTELPDVEVEDPVQPITYYHLLFDGHEIIYAEGTPTESMHTGPEAMKTLPPEALEEIFQLFPELAERGAQEKLARFTPKGRQQRSFIARLEKNNRPFVATV